MSYSTSSASRSFVIHQNPGLIDPAAFTTFGVNSKPLAASPIGYFGTGLKYAIAVLLRHKCPITVWIGTEPHIFEARQLKFRDKDFLQIFMKRQRGVTSKWMAQPLPFTTELGKNWELWQAYRELHANALDEQGSTFQVDHEPPGDRELTRIVVEGEAYAQIHAKHNEIFLESTVAPEGSNHVRCLSRESNYAYYRGLRVLTHTKPSIFTWDIHTSMTLTEDRTLAHPWMVDYYAKLYIMESSNRELIKQALCAREGTFEHSFDYDSSKDSCTISPEFIELARIYGKRNVTHIIERNDRAKALSTELRSDWRRDLAQALHGTDEGIMLRIIREHRAELASLLKRAVERDAR